MKFSEAASEVKNSGLYFKFKDGDNKVRIVSEPVPVWKAFNQEEKKAVVYVTEEQARKNKDAKKRFCFYVINRETGGLQIMEAGSSIMGQLGDLQMTDEYAFDSLPNYDIIIKRSGSALETEYKVIAARQNTELTEEERAMIVNAENVYSILCKDAVDAPPEALR